MIGIAWAVNRRFLTIVIFTVIFGYIAEFPSDGLVPYPIFVFAGMLLWFLFSGVLSEASGSRVGSANLISMVYFPRRVIPTATALVALV